MTRANRPSQPNGVVVLLRITVFRRLWAAFALSSLGDWLGLLATSALAFFLTQDASGLAQGAAVSGVLLTRLLPDLLLAPVAGALVDRFDRRKVAILGDSAAGLLYLSIAFADQLAWLYIAQFLVEAIGLFSTPAKQALWVNITPRERLPVANQLNYVSVYGMVPVAAGLFAVLSTVAQFFGATEVATATPTDGETVGASSLLSGTTSSLAITIALCVDALTYFIAAATVFASRRMIPPFVGERSTSTNIFSLIAEGISFVRKNRLMRSIYIGILGAFAGGGLVAGVALPYVTGLGAGDAGFAILFGSVFTGLALGMLIGPKVLPTVPRRMIFPPAIGAAGVALIVMSVLQDLIGAVVAAALMGLFAGIAWITGFTMIGQEVSDQLRGRVFAFVMSSVRVVLLGTIAVGPVLAGLIGSHSLVIGGFEWPFSGAAVVLAIGGLAAIAVSTIAGHQIGGLASALLRRLLGRRSTWYEPDDHSGVLIAVEGMHGDQVATLALAVNDELHRQGWRTESERFDAHLRQPVGLETPAGALRAIADLAEFTAERLRPALQAGAVVVCEGYVDAVVVRFMSLDGQPEERMWRAAQWAVGGLRPDLIVLIDPRASVVAAEPDQSAIDGAAVTPIESPGPPAPVSAADAVRLEVPVGPDEDDPDHHVDPAQAYLDRASYTPERYLVVAPIAEPSADLLSGELRERIGSVLRQRSPVLAESQRTG